MDTRKKITELAQKRILVLDGAFGSLIQAHRTSSGEPLSENDFRGLGENGAQEERFASHPVPLKGCNDLLCLTQPELISGFCSAYLEAGADIIETCSFNSTAVSLADYGLADAAYEICKTAAIIARKAAGAFSTPEKPRFVAGSMGPTAKSASIAPDMDAPEKRAVSWDMLAASYYDNVRGLLDGGADLILIETVFDTLNAKAAVFAVKRIAEERGMDIPIIVSATVSDNGGKLLSGQSVEAFCASLLHANPLALGLNCSFGAEKLKPYVAAISKAAPCLVIAYPNAGFPNRLGKYEETPVMMADQIEQYMREGLVNIVGGCCGTTPDHIAAIAKKAEMYAPRQAPASTGKTLLAGHDVMELNRELVLAVAQTAKQGSNTYQSEFNRLLKNKDYDGAVELVQESITAGAKFVDVCIDSFFYDSTESAKIVLSCFLNFALQFPCIARLPVFLNTASWDIAEAGLKCLQGKSLINALSLKSNSGEELKRRSRLVHFYGAAVLKDPDENEADPF